jgi:hypothetical protein
MTAPIASGWSKIAGWVSHPLENAALARRTPILALQLQPANGDYAATHFILRPEICTTVNAHILSFMDYWLRGNMLYSPLSACFRRTWFTVQLL